MSQLVQAEVLLKEVFGREANKASMIWLWRQRRARRIPYIKLGKSIYYDPVKVREHLERRQTMQARN